jgi:hypothetical protein
MPYSTHPIQHRATDFTQDAKSGLLLQSPESTGTTPGGLRATGTVADVAYGNEFTLIARCGIAANSPAAATTYRTVLYNKNAPKLRVLEVRFQVVDLTEADFTAGDAGNLDVTLIRGDGAESETESDILADFALDDAYANGEGASFPTATVPLLAGGEVVAGGSLYADLIVDPDATAGATNDGALVDVIVRCIRIP